jgi:poly-gamma-glutamate capsule biosynthesis protein CapA/YwtB (metallophosphatase superfamily)
MSADDVTPSLPQTFRDAFSLRWRQRLVYGAVIGAAERIGFWRRGMRAEGDFARMSTLDKMYWVYKATSPIRFPRRGSGLEAYFAARADLSCVLPARFIADRELSLSAAGDLMGHAFLEQSANTLYREVEDLIFGADVSMANMEYVVEPPKSGALVIAPERTAQLGLDRAQFRAISSHNEKRFSFLATACNHSLDFGADGVDGTVTALRRDGIAFHGINEAGADGSEPAVVEHHGIRIGALSFSFGLNAQKPPADRPGIVNVMDLTAPLSQIDFSLLHRQLAQCRSLDIDFVVAHLHWGLEHEMYPTPEQVEVAHHIAELGVDAIVGHHPHVLQPSELYRTERDPDRLVPICYSLGNLVNPCSAPYLCKSGVLRLTLAKGVVDGSRRTYVAEARVVDVMQQVDRESRTISITMR